MASPQHDVVLRVNALCLFQWKRANARITGSCDCRRPRTQAAPRGTELAYSFPNAEASRDDAALEFGFLDDGACLLGDIDRVASLNRYSVFCNDNSSRASQRHKSSEAIMAETQFAIGQQIEPCPITHEVGHVRQNRGPMGHGDNPSPDRFNESNARRFLRCRWRESRACAHGCEDQDSSDRACGSHGPPLRAEGVAGADHESIAGPPERQLSERLHGDRLGTCDGRHRASK
jgi:hypothetical protein